VQEHLMQNNLCGYWHYVYVPPPPLFLLMSQFSKSADGSFNIEKHIGFGWFLV